jgi:hypothetical protein
MSGASKVEVYGRYCTRRSTRIVLLGDVFELRPFGVESIA